MKKWMSFLLVLVLCLTLAACGGGQPESSTPSTDGSTTTTTTAGTTTDTAASVSESTTTASLTTTTAGTTAKPTTKPAPPTKPPTLPTTKPTTKAPQTQSDYSPLLYQVTNPAKGNSVYVFGSIHVGQQDMYPLPAYVTKAFNACDSLAVECDIVAFEQDAKAQMVALTPLIYTDGTTVSAHLPSQLYQSGVAILKENRLYDAAMEYYCPVMWSNMIESSLYAKLGLNGDLGVDRYLLQEAKKQGKSIAEIESAKQQYQMMADFSLPLQQLLLEGAIEEYKDIDGTKAQMTQLLTVWKKGNPTELKKLLADETEFADDTERRLYEEYENAMTVTRNQKMAAYAEEALQSGTKLFICVGAAHVVGENGIIDRLKQQGFQIEQIDG